MGWSLSSDEKAGLSGGQTDAGTLVGTESGGGGARLRSPDGQSMRGTVGQGDRSRGGLCDDVFLGHLGLQKMVAFIGHAQVYEAERETEARADTADNVVHGTITIRAHKRRTTQSAGRG